MKIPFAKTRNLGILSLCFVGSIFVRPAQAMKIQALKGERALLNLEQAPAQAGDTFFALDGAGKKKALLQITQVKNGRAVAKIKKGHINGDPQAYSLQAAPMAGPVPADKASNKSRSGFTQKSWGYLIGVAQNSMQVKITDTASVKMTGTGFNLEGFYEKVLDGNVSVMARGGYDNLKASGSADSAVCTNSTSCTVDIGYLGFEGLVRYNIKQKTGSQFWLGGGMSFLFALSKSSNVIDTTKISTNQKLLLAFGYDWKLTPRTYIPLQFDYAIYPNNSTVTTNQMILRAGYGMRF